MRMIHYTAGKAFSRTARFLVRPVRRQAPALAMLCLALTLASPIAASAGPGTHAMGVVLDVFDMLDDAMRDQDRTPSRRPAHPAPVPAEEARVKAQAAIQERALFVAEVEGELLAAGFDGSLLIPAWERESYQAASFLWSISSSPRLLERAKADLLDTRVPPYRRLDDLDDLVSSFYETAGEICSALEDCTLSRDTDTLESRIVNREALAAYLPFTGDNLEALWDLLDDGPDDTTAAIRAVWQFREQPEELAALFDVLSNAEIPDMRRQQIARRIAANPEGSKSSLDTALSALRQENLYYISTLFEFDMESIGLPFTSLFPPHAESADSGTGETARPGARAVTAEGAVPLAVSAPASGLVSVRELHELVPAPLLEELGGLGYTDPAPELPIGKEGETIYAIVGHFRQGEIPIFEGSVLGDMAASGPCILPYNDATARYFDIFLDKGRSVPLFAAVGTPEEVAVHLTSLSVMVSERERSLYGPFEAYDVRPEEEALRAVGAIRVSPDEYPADLPGKLPRMTNPADPAFIATLARHADAAGLARLMGPIRAIWTPTGQSAILQYALPGLDGGGAPFWLELRYAPTEAPAVSVLGDSPLLALDGPVLKALHAAHLDEIRAHTVGALSYGACDSDTTANAPAEDSPACHEMRAAIQSGVTAAYWGLGQLRFRSPAELHGISYALLYFRDDADKSAALFALLQDASKTTVQKYTEVIDLLRAAENTQKTEQPATPSTPADPDTVAAPASTTPDKTDAAGEPAKPSGSSDQPAQTDQRGPDQGRYGSWDDDVTGNGK